MQINLCFPFVCITLQDNKWIVQGTTNYCLEIKPTSHKLVVNKCDEDNANMQWEFGFVNQTAIRNQ